MSMAWQKRGSEAEGGSFGGGTWHIFPHVLETKLVNGEVHERKTWRGVVHTNYDDKRYWKANIDKRIVELWVKDKVRDVEKFIHTPKIYNDSEKNERKNRKKRKLVKF